jgi:tricorn protease
MANCSVADGRKLAFSDKRLSLWVVNLDSGTARRIDTATFPGQDFYFPAWSPDSRWIAYSKPA